MRNQHPNSTDHSSHPPKKDGESTLRLVAWETTRNCNLDCIHCRASATTGPHSGELDTAEAFRLLRPGGWLLVDVSDGCVVKNSFVPKAWHAIGDDTIVCRQRELRDIMVICSKTTDLLSF